MKVTRGKGIIISLIVIVILGGILWGLTWIAYKEESRMMYGSNNAYVKNYADELGTWGWGMFITPEKIFQRFGLPEEVKVEDIGYSNKEMDIKVQGNTFTFIFKSTKTPEDIYKTDTLYSYVLESDTIKLGNKQISVGSSREEVIAAYGEEGMGEEPGTSYAASDWTRGFAKFYYDENDIVEKIEVYPYGII
ncbi:hypothetical protein [Christensenella tenuis]|jgi:hypothetical protein|uniref:Uncharacterized protein n=1 Tax=Christensenella tenuis TaxID=2763033 RepID=A0ABR7EGU3_9FIRM|nr:hypothetical protein [Christensenella tenuis]MBC5648977.1 hypothetical protein [Christensenella tenuis]